LGAPNVSTLSLPGKMPVARVISGEHSGRTVESVTHTLDIPWSLYGINPEPFYTDFRTVKGPLVCIACTSRCNWPFDDAQLRSGKHVRSWQHLQVTAHRPEFAQTLPICRTGRVEKVRIDKDLGWLRQQVGGGDLETYIIEIFNQPQ